MKFSDVLFEGQIAQKIIRDPRTLKMLSIAWKHDHSLPLNLVAKLGHQPTPEQIANAWDDLLTETFATTTQYGDVPISRFADWLIKLYINGVADFEDISGEAKDSLAVWLALSTRGLLMPSDQDFNRFTNIYRLNQIKNKPKYAQELRRIKNAEIIEKHKRERKETVIYQDDRFRVTVPFNYGACYTFNNAEGFNANFCTGSSNGLTWFDSYAPEGIIVSITDKSNINDKNGKWQFHTKRRELVNATQDDRGNLPVNDQRFAKLFPGLMKKIVAGIESHANEINQKSRHIIPSGYNVPTEIDKIKNTYPVSYASEEPLIPGADAPQITA